MSDQLLFADADFSSTSSTELFAPGVNATYLMTNVLLCNSQDSTVYFTLEWHDVSGAITYTLLTSVEVKAHDTRLFELSIPVEYDYAIYGYVSNDQLSVVINGRSV